MTTSEIFEMAPYVEKASRLELLIRWLYGILLGIVYGLWGFLISFVDFLQFFHILIFGRRGARLYRYSRQYLAATVYISAYLSFLTDSRPEIIPDLLVYFRKAAGEQPAGAAAPARLQYSLETKHCMNCGATIPAAAKFCGSCGAKQS